jgi:hypothetical protein
MAAYFFTSEQQESEERSNRILSRNKRRGYGYQESSEYSGQSFHILDACLQKIELNLKFPQQAIPLKKKVCTLPLLKSQLSSP